MYICTGGRPRGRSALPGSCRSRRRALRREASRTGRGRALFQASKMVHDQVGRGHSGYRGPTNAQGSSAPWCIEEPADQSRNPGRLSPRLRADGPLVSPSGDLDGEAPGAEWGDDQAAAHVGGIRLGMAWRTERHQAVEIEVRAPLGALDDVVDLRGRPSGPQTSPRPRARRKTTWVQAVHVVPSWANAGEVRTASYVEVALSGRESWREGKEEDSDH